MYKCLIIFRIFSLASACFSSIFLRLFTCLMWVTGTLRLLTSIRRFFPSVYIIVNDDRPQSKDVWSKTTRGLYLHLGTCDPLYFFSQKGFTGVGSPAVKASVGV